MKSTYTNTVERGILTSAYKREIKEDIYRSKEASLSKVKSFIINHPRNLDSEIATILRVSLFVVAIVLITY